MEKIRLLNTKNLSVGYKNSDESKLLLQNLNLEVFKADIIAVLGANGIGKSTLIKTLCGFIESVEGEVNIINKSINALSKKELADNLSVVLTDHLANQNMSVFETVSFGRYPFTNWIGKLKETDIEIIENSLIEVDMLSYRDRKINSLSDGEKQRVLIAKALAQQTPLIILDEPIAHLDLVNRINVLSLLRKLAKEKNKAIVLSIHELEMAIQVADIFWLLKPDKSIETGAPEDMIINNKINELFVDNQLVFNKANGSFEMPFKSKGVKLNLKGEQDYLYYWTKNALLKSGFEIDKKSKTILEINSQNKSWLIDNKEFFNIESLIKYLNN